MPWRDVLVQTIGGLVCQEMSWGAVRKLLKVLAHILHKHSS